MQCNLTRVHFQVLERGKLLSISMFLENNTLVRCFCLKENKASIYLKLSVKPCINRKRKQSSNPAVPTSPAVTTYVHEYVKDLKKQTGKTNNSIGTKIFLFSFIFVRNWWLCEKHNWFLFSVTTSMTLQMFVKRLKPQGNLYTKEHRRLMPLCNFG